MTRKDIFHYSFKICNDGIVVACVFLVVNTGLFFLTKHSGFIKNSFHALGAGFIFFVLREIVLTVEKMKKNKKEKGLST